MEIHISMQEGTLLVYRNSKEIRGNPQRGLKTTYITTHLYLDRATIAQLLPARRLCFFVFAI